MIEDMKDLHAPALAHEGPDDVNRFRAGYRTMIDTFSLVLSHLLMFILAVKIVVHPDVNTEPDVSGRHFKQVIPRARNEEDTGA